MISEIESCLESYDRFAKSTREMLALSAAQPQDVQSIKNWLDGTGCVARDERMYLDHERELVALSPAGDNAVLQLETWVEKKLAGLSGWRHARRWLEPLHACSSDTHIFAYSNPDGQTPTRRIAEALFLCVITLLLLMPVVICNLLAATSSRIVVVMFCTVTYLVVLSCLTRARSMELVLAGVTYATLLIVFVSGTSTV